MSKSILGGRNTINIGTISFSDLEVDTVTVDSLTASRGVVSDANKNLISTTATATEINYLSGVSSAIQTQINTKQATITAGTNLSFDGATLNASAATITANRLAVSNGSGAIIASAVTDTEAGYLDGVSSAIQTQINAKQATIGDGDLTIARTSGLQTALDAKQATISAGTNLSFDGATLNNTPPTITANRLAVSNGSGVIIASAVTDTEAGYLDGVSSAIQTQINTKLNTTVIQNRIDDLGFTGTSSSGNNWNIRISGGRTGVNNWAGAKASNEFGGSLALGGDFDGATVGLRVTYDIQQRYGYFESDDRIKHKEYATTNCLAKIMVLTPKTYIKTRDMYPYDFVLADDRSNLNEGDSVGVECGFIAQEVLKSAEDNKYDELGFSVMGGDYQDENNNTVEDKYIVNYNNLFTVAVGAIKELKLELDTLKARIVVLEA